MFRKTVSQVAVVFLFFVLSGVCAWAQKEEAAGGHDLQKLTQQSSNPVGDLWMITNQFNFNLIRSDKGKAFKDPKLQFNWNFQPVLTFDLGHDMRLVTRPVIPVYNTPYASGLTSVKDKFGLGDAQFMAMIAPDSSKSTGFFYGVGPSAVFPTATDKVLGSGKWQLGPAVAALYMDEKWIVGAFPQHWWSLGGDTSRKDVSLTKVQYFVWYSFAPTWQVGMAPNVLVNWMESKAENRWTVPVGLGVSKLVMLGKLPVKFGVEADYSVIRPRDIPGNEWTFKFTVTPILPKLF